mmetsp:Transcript_34425/g.75332  ORF Transcript_34425/g.75332 Transcript_34425/m.75332 type:complete len:282 (+) Transcript_34425:720-1565(+)
MVSFREFTSVMSSSMRLLEVSMSLDSSLASAVLVDRCSLQSSFFLMSSSASVWSSSTISSIALIISSYPDFLISAAVSPSGAVLIACTSRAKSCRRGEAFSRAFEAASTRLDEHFLAFVACSCTKVWESNDFLNASRASSERRMEIALLMSATSSIRSVWRSSNSPAFVSQVVLVCVLNFSSSSFWVVRESITFWASVLALARAAFSSAMASWASNALSSSAVLDPCRSSYSFLCSVSSFSISDKCCSNVFFIDTNTFLTLPFLVSYLSKWVAFLLSFLLS